MMMDQSAMIIHFEQKFKALADQKRLTILHELNTHGEVCVCDLETMLNLPQSKLSYHLKLLLDADLIKSRKEGRWNFYKVNEKAISMLLSEEACCVFHPPVVMK